MKVSRRDFVTTASCAAAASLCAVPSFASATSNSDGNATWLSCALLDLQSSCALPESFDGMRAALRDGHRCVAEGELAPNKVAPRRAFAIRDYAAGEFMSASAGTLIVAGAGAVRSETFGAVAALLEKGARVVWESGAAFLEPSSFAEQQGLAREYFGISMERPVDVWSRSVVAKSSVSVRNSSEPNRSARAMRAIGHERVAYIAYRWPREVHVRDFSRVIPISAASGAAIAHWGELPVAWRKRVGAGTLIFVGSPIGPALRAGDSEAHSLLHLMINA
jgi:hypothetical protein